MNAVRAAVSPKLVDTLVRTLPRKAAPYLPLALYAWLGVVLAYLWRAPCRFGNAWLVSNKQFLDFCYTDIYPLWWNEKLNEGQIPYYGHDVEYPVGIGAVMEIVRRFVDWFRGLFPSASDPEGGVVFYDTTVFLMAICLVAGVVLMGALAGPRRRRDAMWYALAPGLVLSAFINWDLLCGALSLGAFLAWSRRKQVLAGVLLGLAVSTKFYPLVFAGPLLVLALRTGRWRPVLKTLGGAVGAWLVVNVPVMLTAFDGWKRFYVFSNERPADWGSLWYFFEHKQWALFGNQPVPVLGDPALLDTLGVVSLAVLCAGVALLGLLAPTRPRLMQLCFLVLAAFMLTNKVWSPQYVVWLVPFAVLARPNWRPLVWWQLAEIWYFFAIWLFLVDPAGHDPASIADSSYYLAVWARAIAVIMLMAFVVRDILRPGRDLVRRDGVDDPSGGVFDGAEDRFRLKLGVSRPEQPAHV
jgi:uncharacterized membrane protein